MADSHTYPPLDTPKHVADGLWVIDSGPIHAALMPLPVRMTVVRLADGGLWLHSPTRYDEPLHRALEAIGPIRHLVAPNIGHWTFLKAWQQNCPEAAVWAAPGLRDRAQVRRSGLRVDRDLPEQAPLEWAGEFEQVVVPGALGFREVAFFHTRTRTLVLTDLVINLEREKMPAAMRPLARLLGIAAPKGRAPAYLRLLVRLGGDAATAAGRRLVALAPDRVLFAHGRWFERDGAQALARSLAWLTR